MKNENSEDSLPVVKKNLPDTIYPGVPIEETPAAEPAEEAAADEPAAGVGSEAPAPQTEEASPQKPTPEEQKAKAEELAKAKTGALIYTIAFVVNIIMRLEWQRPMVAAAEAHHYYNALFAIIVFIPTAVSVPAAILTRIIVGEPIRKGLNFYMGAISFLHIMILGGMKPWGAQFLLFALELIFCVAATCEILGYKKGEPFYFVKSVAKSLREKGERRVTK